MFYKYLRNKIGLSTNQILSIRPAGPAPDLNYFRNKVSHLLKLVSGPMLGYSSYKISGFLSNFCCRSIVLFHILKTKFLYRSIYI